MKRVQLSNASEIMHIEITAAHVLIPCFLLFQTEVSVELIQLYRIILATACDK